MGKGRKGEIDKWTEKERGEKGSEGWEGNSDEEKRREGEIIMVTKRRGRRKQVQVLTVEREEEGQVGTH